MVRIHQIAEKHDLKVLEDCAQSFGARYRGDCPGCRGEHCDAERREGLDGRMTGAIGHAGAFSFFPTKNLGAYGDGGLIATDDDEWAETARMLRKHGGKDKYHNEILGYNSRLDALQAAILKVKLPHIDAYNQGRQAVAARYDDLLGEVEGITTPTPIEGHVYHQYTIRIPNGRRDAVKETLSKNDIGCKVYYPVPCHQLPVYDHLNVELPEAERAADEVLSLPMWPQMEAELQERVAATLRNALR